MPAAMGPSEHTGQLQEVSAPNAAIAASTLDATGGPSHTRQSSFSIVSPRGLWGGFPGGSNWVMERAITPRPSLDEEDDDLCASAAVLRKLSRLSREEKRRTSSSKPFSWRELELTSKKLDDAHLKISQIDLSCLEVEGDELPLKSPYIRYNFRVEQSSEELGLELPTPKPLLTPRTGWARLATRTLTMHGERMGDSGESGKEADTPGGTGSGQQLTPGRWSRFIVRTRSFRRDTEPHNAAQENSGGAAVPSSGAESASGIPRVKSSGVEGGSLLQAGKGHSARTLSLHEQHGQVRLGPMSCRESVSKSSRHSVFSSSLVSASSTALATCSNSKFNGEGFGSSPSEAAKTATPVPALLSKVPSSRSQVLPADATAPASNGKPSDPMKRLVSRVRSRWGKIFVARS